MAFGTQPAQRSASRCSRGSYQATWFRVLLAVALCTVILTGVILRERRIRTFEKAVADAREGERRQVAHQLHDDFFPSVYGLFLSINRVTATLPEQAVQRTRLQSIVDESGDILEHGRELIQRLRSGAELRSTLFEELATFGKTQETVFSIAFQSDRTGPELALPQERYDQAAAIGREALWNAFRHSEARAISLVLQVSASEARIVVSDDGKGLPSGVLDYGKPGHFGLTTMRERAERLQGKLQIHSSPIEGTRIALTFPVSATG